MPDASGCPGCGGVIPPRTYKGAPLKWCSSTCRPTAAKQRYRSKASTKEKERAYAKEYNARYYVGDRKRAIGHRVKLRKYGLTAEEHAALEARAAGRCEVCRDPFGESKETQAHIDHCHETGVVRGLLCAPCNWALGNARDNAGRLRALADYVERNGFATG